MPISSKTSALLTSLLTIAALGGPSVAFAQDGGRDGGGGAVIVCRDAHGAIQGNPKLFDFVEAEQGPNHATMIRSQKAAETQIEELFARWKTQASGTNWVGSRMRNQLLTLRRALQLVKRDWTPIAQGASLPFWPDVFPKTPWRDQSSKKVQCSMETVAIYDDEKNTLAINLDIFSKMSPTDQAGLRVHEAVYKLNRLFNKEGRSTDTRVAVATLFSTSPIPDLVSFPKRYGDLIPTIADRFPENEDGSQCSPLDGTDCTTLLALLLGDKTLTCVAKDNPSQKISFSVDGGEKSVSSGGAWSKDDEANDRYAADIFKYQRVYNPNNTHTDFLQIEGWVDIDSGDMNIVGLLRMPAAPLLSDDNFVSGQSFDAGTLKIFKEHNQDDTTNPIQQHPMSCRFQ